MAKLSDFRSNSKAISDGVWIRVNEALFGPMEVLTRGFDDRFIDAQNSRIKRAAGKYANDRDRIPNAEHREINAALLCEFLVLDVRGLDDDEGKPIEIKEFYRLLFDEDYSALTRACWEAAQRVTSMSKEQLDAALGNSRAPSKSTSSGATPD